MVAAGATHAVVEVSSLDLARHTLAGVTLDAVCLTELGRRHVDRHGSLENYVSAQRRVLEFLHPDAVAVLNADDPASMHILAELARPALTFGMKKPCEISAQVVEQFVNEQTFLLSAGDDTVGVRTEIVGDHHVYNCLAAATTALAYGVELTAIARGLESVDVLPGRMERVVCGQDFAVLVDAANTPDALRHCLRTARQVTSGRLICVFGATLDCDPSELPAIGRVIGSYADAAVVTNGGPADAGSHRTCLEIRSGFAQLDKVQVVLDRREAIRGALREAQAGDTIVLAGVGDRPHTPIAGEMLASDSELVKEVLRAPAVTLPFRLAA
jgi:UDP-N-acetylmuramoyl-L-alanyl-D-glutamate--2,6-diaminopimelate ligase